MNDNERLEDLINKGLEVRASDGTYERMRQIILDSHGPPGEGESAEMLTIARRITMRSTTTKCVSAALILVAVLVGMYILTGSVDVTSITIAEVKDAMEQVNWLRMRHTTGPEVAWYGFGSKIQIGPNDGGGIIYFDFNRGKQQVWKPGSEVIYESPIDENRQFAGGVSSPYEAIKVLDSLEEDGWEVTKELGTYDDLTVEVWTASQKASTTLLRLYIDAERKLPVALAAVAKGSDGTARIQKEVVFDYPQTGPADIYEAGAPRSAQIESAPEP